MSKPPSKCSSVDFPEPLTPRTATNCPCSTCKFTSVRARISAGPTRYCRDRPRVSIKDEVACKVGRLRKEPIGETDHDKRSLYGFAGPAVVPAQCLLDIWQFFDYMIHADTAELGCFAGFSLNLHKNASVCSRYFLEKIDKVVANEIGLGYYEMLPLRSGGNCGGPTGSPQSRQTILPAVVAGQQEWNALLTPTGLPRAGTVPAQPPDWHSRFRSLDLPRQPDFLRPLECGNLLPLSISKKKPGHPVLRVSGKTKAVINYRTPKNYPGRLRIQSRSTRPAPSVCCHRWRQYCSSRCCRRQRTYFTRCAAGRRSSMAGTRASSTL